MGLGAGADQHTEVEMKSRCGDGEVVGGDEAPSTAQSRKELGPLLSNFAAEVDD